MTDDSLERATRALRDETGEPELRSGLTRARLLDSAARQGKRRGVRLRWVLPFVLTFGASAALAQVTHQYFPAVWNAVMPDVLDRHVPDEAPVRRANDKARKARAPELEPPEHAVEAPAPEPVIEASIEDQPAPPAQPPAPKAHGPRLPAAHTVPQATAPAQEPPVLAIKPSAEPGEPAELSLFRRALKLHDQKDPTAIGAWDDFLRVAPNSPLATEARYNLALALVRAGKSHQAKAALAPFARGDFGGYRKREANALLEALEARDAGVAKPAP